MQYFTCSALHVSLPSIAFLNISCFVQHLYYLTCVLTPFQLHQDFLSTAHLTLSSWLYMTLLLLSPLLKIIPICTGACSCSCSSVIHTFTSSLISRNLSISLAKFSKITLRPRLSSINTQRPSSLIDDELGCGKRRSKIPFRARAGLLPLLLDTQYPATRFATFLAWLTSLLGAPTNAFCLPQDGPFFFSLVLENWKILLPLLVDHFQMYLRQTFYSPGSIKRSKIPTSTFISTLLSR